MEAAKAIYNSDDDLGNLMSYDTDTTPDLPPVTDWVNDWDWLDDRWGPNAIDIWNSVREQCPVATTERYGRAHMPVTMEAVSSFFSERMPATSTGWEK